MRTPSWNLPNILTISRLVATIPLVVLVLIDQPATLLAATALWLFGGITDNLDGRIARRYQLVTRLGVFLDLTADKVWVVCALVALVQVALVPAWIAIVIVTREFVVSGIRSLAAADGVVIPSHAFGKQKTALTLVGIGGVLLARGLGGATAFPLALSTAAHGPQSFSDWLLVAADLILLWAVLWTILSAIEYIREGWPVIASPGKPTEV